MCTLLVRALVITKKLNSTSTRLFSNERPHSLYNVFTAQCFIYGIYMKQSKGSPKRTKTRVSWEIWQEQMPKICDTPFALIIFLLSTRKWENLWYHHFKYKKTSSRQTRKSFCDAPCVCLLQFFFFKLSFTTLNFFATANAKNFHHFPTQIFCSTHLLQVSFPRDFMALQRVPLRNFSTIW